MRGNSKDGYTTNTITRSISKGVLLDSCSNGDHIFVSKDKPMLLPCLKRLVTQSWNTLNGIFHWRCKAQVELNFFKYSDSKRFYAEPDVVEYDKDSKLQYDLILGTKTMKEFGIILRAEESCLKI
jgi:hypothetical protein